MFWVMRRTCSLSWVNDLRRCGGGFFHSPLGVAAAAPAAQPVFLSLCTSDGESLGIAAAVRTRCRLGLRVRHWYLPTVPALAHGVPRDAALATLCEAVRAQGAAEVVLDSFDARWRPDRLVRGRPEALRLEYLVSLEPDPDELARRCHETHRRHLRRGEHRGWRLRTTEGAEAVSVLRAVRDAVSQRAGQRGDPFEAQLPLETLRRPVSDLAAPWGTATFSAWDGSVLLAAAWVGWANRRAIYLTGGSTAEGYRHSAAVWLHWRVMSLLAERGFNVYNLGGTPASALQPEHPAHGLFRFKRGFGAEIIPQRGVRCALRAAHLLAHRVARRLVA